jgi:hypothetical protein
VILATMKRGDVTAVIVGARRGGRTGMSERLGSAAYDAWMRRAFAWRDWTSRVRMVEHHGRPRR